ncbi:MAG: ABC transporter permease [Flavobacteriales bacterium]|nr:ABC transporter permease [Flavobacteriales bacterium]
MMRGSLIGAVIAREWRTRVVKRSFLIGTLLMPILAVGVLAGTVLITQATDTTNVVLVEDAPGLISRVDPATGQQVPRCPGCFPERDKLTYRFTREAPADSIWLEEGFTVLVEYDGSVLQNRAGYLVYDKSPGMTAKRNIERDLSKAMEHARVLESTELDWQAYQRLKFELNLIDREANGDMARTDGGGEEVRGFIGFFFSALLFLVLSVYGGMILRSVVEEKSNRVVEVLIAAVRPEELLLGKVIGMGAVALTQLVAWSVLSTLAFSAFQFVFDSGALGASLPGQGEVPTDLLTAMAENEITSILLDINWTLMALSTIGYFIGGYLLYGSIYAAVGGSVQSEQEGQGMVIPIIMPLMFAYIIGSGAMSNPEMGALTWLSWFPLTSPVIMLVRVAVGVAWWEVVLSWGLLMLSARIVLGLAGRAYRFGVLHTGKSSGWSLLLQWIRGHGS